MVNRGVFRLGAWRFGNLAEQTARSMDQIMYNRSLSLSEELEKPDKDVDRKSPKGTKNFLSFPMDPLHIYESSSDCLRSISLLCQASCFESPGVKLSKHLMKPKVLNAIKECTILDIPKQRHPRCNYSFVHGGRSFARTSCRRLELLSLSTSATDWDQEYLLVLSSYTAALNIRHPRKRLGTISQTLYLLTDEDEDHGVMVMGFGIAAQIA